MPDIHRLSARELAAAIARGAVSSRAALDHFLARIDARGQAINALAALDIDGAREHADAADAALARGWSWGPLHGVPMTVKDTFEALGLPTTVGEPSLADYQSQRDAVVVQRLRAAGAVIFGKTNTPRLAQDVQSYNPIVGTTNNPWDTTRTPGGSSGGAAAALAAGFTPLEVGSDLAGSIRTPASWCGVYGHKTSYGLIPMRGHVPGPPGTLSQPDLCVPGPLARSADDLELALEVLAGPDELEAPAWRLDLCAPRPTTFADYRVGYRFVDDFSPITKASRACLTAAVETAAGAGATVAPIERLPEGFERSYDIYDTLLNALVGAGLPEKLYARARRGARMLGLVNKTDAGTVGGFSRRATASHRDWAVANEARAKLRAAWHALFADYDVVLLPSVPVPAIGHNQEGNLFERSIDIDGSAHGYTELFRWISPATVAGLPATVAPAGATADGLPIGLQIVADYGLDRTSIAFAQHLASVAGGFNWPPDYA